MSFSSLQVQIAPLIVHLATASLLRGLNALLLEALVRPEIHRSRDVAANGLTQTIGFLRKFVKLIIYSLGFGQFAKKENRLNIMG